MDIIISNLTKQFDLDKGCCPKCGGNSFHCMFKSKVESYILDSKDSDTLDIDIKTVTCLQCGTVFKPKAKK